MKLITNKNKNCSNKMRTTDLHLRILALYLTAVDVGSSSSQYQWMVSSVTNFAQILSSNLVLVKILSRKLNSSRSTCGCHLTAKEEDG